jgi:hypothetical protein
LEQIFNFFAGQQEEEKGPAAGIIRDLKSSLGVTIEDKKGTSTAPTCIGGGSKVLPAAAII